MKEYLTTESLNALTAEYGDSFYILDTNTFVHNYSALTESFREYYQPFNIAYSYKTNYTPRLCKIVDDLGGFAEVVSEMELELALRIGVHAGKIIWNGPIKNFKKVEELLLNGGIVNIDSSSEAKSILRIAKAHPNIDINVGIRCNYDVGDGVLSRFGFDVNDPELDIVLKTIADTANINLVSLHAHFAKRSPEYWTMRAKGLLNMYKRITCDYSFDIKYIDLGGGIYGNMPNSLCQQLGIGSISFFDYASRAANVFSSYFNDFEKPPMLIIEPGSALTGDCMEYICKIKTIKEIRGKIFVTTSGSQKNISMGGINPPLRIVSSGNKQKMCSNADIVGYTCIEGDVLQKDYNGPLAVGDYIVIDNCGSYSLVMKPPFILPNVPVIEIGKGIKVIKRKETFDDIFGSFIF